MFCAYVHFCSYETNSFNHLKLSPLFRLSYPVLSLYSLFVCLSARTHLPFTCSIFHGILRLSLLTFSLSEFIFPEVAAGSPCRRERQSNCNLKGSCAQENKFRVCEPHQTDTDDIRKPCKAGPINVITTKNCLFISISSSALFKKMSTSVVCTGFGMLREDSDGVCCVACGPQW